MCAVTSDCIVIFKNKNQLEPQITVMNMEVVVSIERIEGTSCGLQGLVKSEKGEERKRKTRRKVKEEQGKEEHEEAAGKTSKDKDQTLIKNGF